MVRLKGSSSRGPLESHITKPTLQTGCREYKPWPGTLRSRRQSRHRRVRRGRRPSTMTPDDPRSFLVWVWGVGGPYRTKVRSTPEKDTGKYGKWRLEVPNWESSTGSLSTYPFSTSISLTSALATVRQSQMTSSTDLYSLRPRYRKCRPLNRRRIIRRKTTLTMWSLAEKWGSILLLNLWPTFSLPTLNTQMDWWFWKRLVNLHKALRRTEKV